MTLLAHVAPSVASAEGFAGLKTAVEVGNYFPPSVVIVGTAAAADIEIRSLFY